MSWKPVLLGGSRLTPFLLRSERTYCSKNILKLQERGMYADIFPGDSANEVSDLINKQPQTVYSGFDPTADSLHIGNLLVLMNLFHWQRGGHNVIILLGGATATVGDPSGKNSERKKLYKVEVEKNTKEIESLLKTIIDNHESLYARRLPNKLKPITIVNNADWYENMSALEFLGDVGRNFRIGTMLGRQSVRDRMNSGDGMSFTEFSYQILQAYDWLHLYEHHNCRFQIGGNDQTGNIWAGFDLIQRIHNKRVFGLTVPLMTNEEGDKYGKSGGNAIWLSRLKTSAFQLYQFFIRTKDSEVQKLLMLYTFESVPRVLEIMKEHWKDPEKRLAQRFLAEEVVRLVHGEEGVLQAERITNALYNRSIEALQDLDVSDIQSAFEGATTVEMLLKPGTTLLDAALDAGCFKSEKDALRISSAGGFYINHQRASNLDEVVTPASHILPNNLTLMRVGRKHYYIVKWL
ncbi:UNVERIFIED_CONTAM: hypothetical protein PYX00_001183 [Menopon gallinae]|uniref:Tyrosine--tRNA ligase n=1 Tax=Menopon gallinae TaxID=328185 RepID=A0AAW2IBK8_9NEOP